METTFSTCKISPSIPLINDHSLIKELPQIQNIKGYTSTRHGQRGCGLVMSCGKSGDGSSTEIEAKIKSERNLDFGMEGKCEEKRGIVELLECLESEAIMGEDQGKEACDYNRRAQIFDKSAQVFQVLKEQTEESPTEQAEESPMDT